MLPGQLIGTHTQKESFLLCEDCSNEGHLLHTHVNERVGEIDSFGYESVFTCVRHEDRANEREREPTNCEHCGKLSKDNSNRVDPTQGGNVILHLCSPCFAWLSDDS